MKYIVAWSFGSAFAGGVCDDGPAYESAALDLEDAKAFLVDICRTRCVATISSDGMSATFENWNGSQTGSARIIPATKLELV